MFGMEISALQHGDGLRSMENNYRGLHSIKSFWGPFLSFVMSRKQKRRTKAIDVQTGDKNASFTKTSGSPTFIH